ncbi:hypothetical protein, partial [Gemmiger sp.]|uniref:hypothetical protein n=1 Tax=Gemmiger sp. TaxID=2049027 RepID=UPI003A938AD8
FLAFASETALKARFAPPPWVGMLAYHQGAFPGEFGGIMHARQNLFLQIHGNGIKIHPRRHKKAVQNRNFWTANGIRAWQAR